MPSWLSWLIFANSNAKSRCNRSFPALITAITALVTAITAVITAITAVIAAVPASG